MRKFSSKILVFWGALALVVLAAFNVYNGSMQQTSISSVDFSDFVQEVEVGNVKYVTIKGMRVIGNFQNGKMFSTVVPFQDRDLVSRLMQHHVRIKATMPEEPAPTFFQVFISWLPMILIVGVWLFSMRQMGRGSSRAMGFGRARPKKAGEKEKKVTFKDVAGADEAKEDMMEIVEFLKNPKKFEKLGGRMPKGVLLIGPPGTGKTLLARAVAGEASCTFFSISASEFVEMFVGVGASRVRDLFDRARENLPCIIFIDEIDAMGRHRGVGLGGGNDEREQTLNEFLVQLDGFSQNKGLVVFGATNRPDVLDKALTRSGRFDRQIIVGLPDIKQREAILKVHSAKTVLAEGVDLSSIAKGTPGFSGADLENLVNEAALLAARKDQTAVTLEDLEEAKDKIMMGPERKSMIIRDEEKKLTAYHESGHAIVAYYSKYADPIHKATIIPRGQALGMVVQLPDTDRISMTKNQFIDRLRVLMGGRVAEEKVFGKDNVTSGASNDIKVATQIAKKMVFEYGMSETASLINYNDDNGEIHFGYITNTPGTSQQVSEMLDTEVRNLIISAYEFVKDLLSKKEKELHILAELLLEKETLDGQEIVSVLGCQ